MHPRQVDDFPSYAKKKKKKSQKVPKPAEADTITTDPEDLERAEKILTELELHRDTPDGKYLLLYKDPKKVEWVTLQTDHELVTTYKKSLKPVNECTEVYDEVALTELFA